MTTTRQTRTPLVLQDDPRERGHRARLLDAHFASTDQAKRMAGEQGVEPWYAGIKIQCLNQLGDSPTQLVACRHNDDFIVNCNARPNFILQPHQLATQLAAGAVPANGLSRRARRGAYQPAPHRRRFRLQTRKTRMLPNRSSSHRRRLRASQSPVLPAQTCSSLLPANRFVQTASSLFDLSCVWKSPLF
jgi:hypothetical protein